MATKLTNKQTAAIDAAAEVLGKTADRRKKIATNFVSKGWAFTLARMAVGALMVTEYRSLRDAYIAESGSDKDIPTEALTDRVLATWSEIGVKGYKWDAIADWDRANGVFQSLSPDFRKQMGDYGTVKITTLKDAAQVPVAESKNKKGETVPPREDVLRQVVESGEATDKAQREIVKAARNGGKLPERAKPTRAKQSESIQAAASELFKTWALPEPNEDGTYTLTLEQVQGIVLFGVKVRDVGGAKDILAYRDAIDERTALPVAPTEDELAAEAALAEAVAEREAAQAALAATDAS